MCDKGERSGENADTFIYLHKKPDIIIPARSDWTGFCAPAAASGPKRKIGK